MNCSDNHCSSCIFDILKKILMLQQQEYDENFVGCDKPFLGPSLPTLAYNTRPIELFNGCTGTTWTFEYTLADGTTGTSNVLRVESLDDCCCTCRILYLDETSSTYVSTSEFVTIDLNYCGAIRCLTDTYVTLN